MLDLAALGVDDAFLAECEARRAANDTPRIDAKAALRNDMMRTIGHAPRELIGDGKLRRFRTRDRGRDDAGWVIFHDDEFPFATYGDHRSGLRATWSAREPSAMSLADRERLDHLKAERERQAEARRANGSERAKARWDRGQPANPNHPYIVRKGIQPHGVRQQGNVLLVPMLGSDGFSLQAIRPDGQKRFQSGAPANGAFEIAGSGDTIIIGEGFATIATLHEATGYTVIAAFSAHNLEAIAKAVREANPTARIVIAADDDHKTELETGRNPGLRAAEKAAKAADATLAAPPFDREKDGVEPSDWNDLAQICGKGSVATAFRWVCYGGQGASTKGPEPAVRCTEFSWPDAQAIPRRDWLFGHQLIRKFVGVVGAPGGVGKTSLLCVEAMSMVSGRALLHSIAPVRPLNVWIFNGEDPREEMERRLIATAKHYGIRREDCEGRLFLDSGRDTRFVIAEMVGRSMEIVRPVVESIKQHIIENRIDVLIVDPFVSTHRVGENDNTSMDAVAREWAKIADHTNCAIELIHHVRKIGDAEVSAESLRGGSALVSACRSVRTLNQMNADEAKKAGVENRRQFFRVDSGKSNMAATASNAQWFQLVSVELNNGDRLHDGDSVAVVAEWEWPNPLDGVTAKDLNAVLCALAGGTWRESAQAKDWVGRAVAEVMGLDADDDRDKSKIKSLLKIWIANGALRVIRRADKNGDERPFVEVAPNDDEGK